MGYRSQVVLAVQDSVFRETLSKESEVLQEQVKKYLELYTDETIHKNGWTLYYWNDIKWYTDHPEYKDITWLDTFSKKFPQKGRLLRLSESLSDYEDFGDPDECPFEIGYECKLTYSY